MSRPATIAAHLLTAAERWPDREFLVDAVGASPRRLTYEAALRRARGCAAHLSKLGVRRGDRVVLNNANSLDYLCAYFGTWLAGATAVPVDHRSRAEHVARVASDCGARCVLVDDGARQAVTEVPRIPLSAIEWDRSAMADGPPTDEASLALVIYTSGTTGTPKGVCLTHQMLEYTRGAITAWAQVSSDDRELTTLSLTHLFGLAHVHVYCALGATVYVADGLRNVPQVLDVLEAERITSFPGTPAGFQLIVDGFADVFASKARSLRYAVINSAPMPATLTRRLLELLPQVRLYMYYGLTEASRSLVISYRDHPEKIETAGRPWPPAEVRIGTVAEPRVGEPGEVLVKGPHVAAQYWGGVERDLFEDGWFHTGDLGVMDADGFVTWLGRVREQINVNGLKLVPAEVEDVLRRDPGVADCAVVGVPDPLTGEAVVACVVPVGPEVEGRELELRRLCKKHLDLYKVPKRVLFVSAIPRTDTGKIKRFLLREQLR